MLPKGTRLRMEEGVLYWDNHNEVLTPQEARTVSERIQKMVEDQKIRAIIVDNRKLEGSWSPEVDRVWIDLMRFLPQHELKTATLCQSVVYKLQLNYLSSQAGTQDSVKAFVEDEREDLMSFLEVGELKLSNYDA